MARIDVLSQKVRDLYEQRLETRADWADWMYANHVFVVTENAKSLAEKYQANSELSQVAAMLHDIADYKIKRKDPDHESESLAVAKQLMIDCDYHEAEIELVIDDAIRLHSCYGDDRPKSQEGLILATADALAHLQTGFYLFALHSLAGEHSLEEIKDWTLKKIDRDFYNKISFEEERDLARPDYEIIKNLFSR